jgi:hypothetical protein
MAVHGISRSTRDLDLLVVESDALHAAMWAPLSRAGFEVDVRRGVDDDPLAGVVRITAPGARGIDVVVGKSPWQRGLVARATLTVIDGERVPVARAADLILLKLYAGGPQDAWDVAQLLESGDRDALVSEVDGALPALPGEARRLWDRIRGG